MSMLAVVMLSAACLTVAYYTYGPLLSRLLRLDPNVDTPATLMRDDVDYVPIESKFLLSQHFSAIAAAGPIVGPILAGVVFGWVPALLWILIGAIFIGGIHDMTALVASIRHKARSIAEVVRDHMSQRSYVLFLSFVWLALVYIIVAFTDVTAASFVKDGKIDGEGNVVLAGGIATSSLLYLMIPMVMGLVLRYTKLSLNWATLIFLPLVAFSIWVGQKIPFDVGQIFGWSEPGELRFWTVALMAYCLIASVIPMWLLLQPRGHLGGYFLYAVLLAGALGIMFGGTAIEYPAFRGFVVTAADGTLQPMFPLLFIMIACGACSGFHSIIASGTTSKQLKKETDACSVGYGAMLLEAMVAVVSLCCVMMLKPSDPMLVGGPKPNFLYANGIGNFMGVIGIERVFAVSFGLMAFTTFVYDTLDVCTRLGRYIIQELTGLSGNVGKWLGTILTAGVPLFFLLAQPMDPKAKPAYMIYWGLFGASNQLLAALTLIGVTVWLWRTYRAKWVLFVVGIPCVLMYTMSMWALVRMILAPPNADSASTPIPLPWVAGVLAALGALILIEAVLAMMKSTPSSSAKQPKLATA
jgi:carbon starvation protein